LFENGSQITQLSGGTLNDAFASQSVGENNQALQMQEGNGNRSVIWQDTQLGSRPPPGNLASATTPPSSNCSAAATTAA
jgi:hypothetical protein